VKASVKREMGLERREKKRRKSKKREVHQFSTKSPDTIFTNNHLNVDKNETS
jgi:hypothetical protein